MTETYLLRPQASRSPVQDRQGTGGMPEKLGGRELESHWRNAFWANSYLEKSDLTSGGVRNKGRMGSSESQK